MSDLGERLRTARQQRGITSASEAARQLGIHVSTYTGWENGSRQPERDTVLKLARRLHVSLEWLMTGKGKMTGGETDANTVPVMGYIGAGGSIEPDYEQTPPEGLFTVELPFPMPDGLVGFEVKGDSMMPRYDEGDVVVVWQEMRRPIEAYYGEEAAVRLEDGRRFLKVLARGSDGSLVTLNSFNARPIPDVHVDWLGEIYATMRSGQVRRLRANEQASRIRRTREREKLSSGTGNLGL